MRPASTKFTQFCHVESRKQNGKYCELPKSIWVFGVIQKVRIPLMAW